MDKQQIADANLQAQSSLWETLSHARWASGLSIDDVAHQLGIDSEVLEAAEDGRVDLSMTDLRQYAYAVGAVVSYRVKINPDSEWFAAGNED